MTAPTRFVVACALAGLAAGTWLQGPAAAVSTRTAAPPQHVSSSVAAPQLQRAIDAFVGEWTITEEYGSGRKGRGTEVWRTGPGGRSLVYEYQTTGNGDRTGMAVFWWDEKERRLQELWCFSPDASGCSVSNADIRWEGNDLLLIDSTPRNGKPHFSREVWSDITPHSHTMTISVGPNSGSLALDLRARATRRTAAPAATAVAQAQVALGTNSTLRFATREEAADLLARNDQFVAHLSAFDLAARVKKPGNVSVQDYLDFARSNAREWTEQEKQTISSGLEGLQGRLRPFDLPLPTEVLLVKTSSQGEAGAPHTRSNAIVLPETVLALTPPPTPTRLQHLVAHELFHVLSRLNPDWRDRLYAAIGFEKCSQLTWPPALADRRITNPDAPTNEHCLHGAIDGKDAWVVPITFAKTAVYDARRGDPFFNYLEFKLLVVERAGGEVKPVYTGGQPLLVDPQQVSGFFEQVGRNTNYIIHPEEILADNFAMLVMGEQAKVKSPEVAEKIRARLTGSLR